MISGSKLKSRLVLTSTVITLTVAAIVSAQQKRPSAPRQHNRFLGREQIREVEERLADLGYWTGPVDGRLDDGSRSALIAFQKVEGRSRNGKLTKEETEAIKSARRPDPLDASYEHIEIDLERQVLFMVDGGGTVSRILPISTGTGESFTSEGWTRPAVTPCGRFTVHRKAPGWKKSPLGLLYYPSYIVGGIAIHGSPAVPVHPASHGCIRIPMFAAREFSELTPIGTKVIVYNGTAP